MMKYHEFDCGCKIPICNDKKDINDNFPSLDINFNEISLSCCATWELLSSGKVTGCFQLESPLGRHWAKKVKPVSIEDAGALVALIRPSCLQSYVDGKCMTQHYTDRKDGDEDYENFHPEADDTLDATYGVILYQEQSIFLARKFAGFSLQEADNLRKAIGHKDAKLMQETRLKFISGCATTKLVTDIQANEIFDIIEASSRYCFNKCLAWDTQVELEDGTITDLFGVQIGNKIKCPSYIDRPKNTEYENRFVTVTGKHYNGVKDLYEIKLSAGQKIRCTMDHKFLCSDLMVYPLWLILHKKYEIITDRYYSEIVSIRRTGMEETLDITVDDDLHCFYGNGIATSNSHAISYGILSYWTAYIKAHFPLHFFAAWLAGCNNKADTEESVGELVSDSKSFKIPIIGPSILKSSENFSIQDLTIRCGLGNIRGVGESGLKKVYESILSAENETKKKLKDFSWFECLIYLLPQVSKTIVSNMLATGCFSHLQMSRQLQMFEYNKVLQLTDKEIERVKIYLKSNLFAAKFSLLDALDYLISTANKSRGPKIVSIKQSISSPPSDVRDTEEWIANVEEHIIGASITCSKLDSCNTASANITCKQFNEAEFAKNCVICGQITRLGEYQPKGGKMAGMTMAYITLLDATGPCEAVAFPNSYKDNSMLLFKGNTVMVTGNKSDKGSLIVNKVEQI